ncbi:MMPL family transporter [Actinacidiphila paucisporea]|uniref:SSD domain-containing protein n=1 Tax=Actinacidiphila paucisporea TaxID=310782 RepID=A0A1M7LEA6_9ACTN|nr:MMPL family transporter [Actinacidiphila paucisporea]SHM76235.1 putative drug exporter of the RND superfamily/hypothetical protein [Actinacidiphila paucisporea]
MGIAASMGSWSARHRWAAVGGWLLFVILAVFVGQSAGRVDVDEDRSMPGEVSQAATINDDAGLKPPASEMVLIQVKGAGSATDLGFRTVVGEVMRAVESTGQVTAVTSPYASRSISVDGRSALVRFDVRGEAKTAADRVEPVTARVEQVQAKHPDLRIEEFGDASAEKVLNDAFGSDFKTAEFSAVPLALGILLIAFGALVAALLPVALAMTAFVAAGGVVAVVSHLVPMSDTANSVMLLVGLAVGVDYCLFYLRREREERAAGHDADTALRIAAATSGRAILISGVTVIVAMAGMLLTGIGDFKAMGVATMIVVAIAMFGSVTVLPALLSLLGHRVEKGRLPFLNRRRRRRQAGGRPAAPGNSRFWRSVLGPVLRHPKAATVIAGGALLALALPAFGMKTANLSMQQELGDGPAIIQTYDRINTAFPGGPDPAHVVVKAGDIDSPAVRNAIAAFRAEAVSSGASKGPVTVTVHSAQNVARIDVPLEGGSDRAKAEADVRLLRNQVRPDTLLEVAGVQAPISGETAGSMDFAHKITSSVPPVFAFVTVFAFLLMLLSFRSLTIALTSIALNLLSVGAAYGILTAVFQHGWGASLVGAHGTGAVVAWLPLFLFVILFGLSMDYHVFVVSRIREARMRGLATKGAIEHGITTTAGVVTSAAVIMVAVFAIFGTLSMQSMKQMGVGLAFAVLIDATVIRGVLLPAVMTLLGDRNWYLPRWMHRLPDLTHDESALPQPPAPAPHPAQQLPDRV